MTNKSRVILVIEDERPLQEAIKMKLENLNYQVVTSRTAEDGFKMLEETKHIDVVWLDHYLLGKESGLDFVVKVKNNDKYKQIPIFVVSNTAGNDKVQGYLRLGVTKYMTKSDYRLDQIIADIEKVLDSKE